MAKLYETGFMNENLKRYYIESKYEFGKVFTYCNNLDNVYEFGVYGGKSILDMLDAPKNHNKHIVNIWGIDSFEGLPDDSGKQEVKDWYKGNFNFSNLSNRTPEDSRCFLESLIKLQYPKVNIRLIRTWFDKLVKDNDFLIADFVNIDCDIYTSTVSALEFLYNNHLLKVGTVIRYDDFLPGNEFGIGEGKAHIEWVEKHNIVCNNPERAIYVIEKIYD